MSTLLGHLFDAVEDLRNTDPDEDYSVDDIADLMSATDEILESKTEDLLREVLRDENGFAPTPAAIEVIMEVVREINRTDNDWAEPDSQPGFWRYALDAERALRVSRKNRR
jgi:hypothetical protein